MLIGGPGSATSHGCRMVPGGCVLRGTQRGEKVLEQGGEVAGVGCSTVEVQVGTDQNSNGAEFGEPGGVGARCVGQLVFPRLGGDHGYLPAEGGQQLVSLAEVGAQVWIGQQENTASAGDVVEQTAPGAVADLGLNRQQATSGVVAVQARSKAR